MSLKRYDWMDPKLYLDNIPQTWEPRTKKLLKSIDEQKTIAFEKNMLFRYLIEQLNEASTRLKSGTIPKILDMSVNKIKKQAGYRMMVEQEKKDDLTKFDIATLLSFSGLYLVMTWLYACFTGSYLINFSIDTIVGVVGLLVAAWFLVGKYKLLKTICKPHDFIWMDVLVVIFCMLVRILTGKMIDLSVLFLLGVYFVEKKKMQTILNTVES